MSGWKVKNVDGKLIYGNNISEFKKDVNVIKKGSFKKLYSNNNLPTVQ